MIIMLIFMQIEEFRVYFMYIVKYYVEEKVKVGIWLFEDVLFLFKQIFFNLFLKGLDIFYYYLWSFMLNEKEIVGWFWIYVELEYLQQEVFIYDFGLYELYWGKGYVK